MDFVFYLLQMLLPAHYMGISTQPLINSDEFYAAQADIVCLTRIIYNESRGETLAGRKLVAQTTLNRVQSGEFQDSVCAAMKAKGAYSFYKRSSKAVDKVRKYPVGFTTVAEEALAGKYKHLISEKVVYFKNCKVYSSFFTKLILVRKEKNHCFYRANEVQLARR